jgi:transaldolase
MAVDSRHVLEKLQATNPQAEIWWDSAPMVYRNWTRRVIENAPAGKKELWTEQLNRLFDPQHPEHTFFRGVTTNPPLSLGAIRDDPQVWADFVQKLIRENPGKNAEQIFWVTYLKIVERGANLFRPSWEKSNHTYGYLSGQVDPRDCFDADRMLKQALNIAQIAPNVMVKVPGTREGYQVIEELTARGIGTNNTLSFTIPQFAACMDAVQNGLATAAQNNTDLSRWRSVITHMSGRFGNLGELKTQADARKIELSEAEVRWAELLIFKRGCRMLQERKHPSKMLICSMRISPPMSDGSMASWHIEKMAGSDVVFACPPRFIEALMRAEDQLKPFNPEAFREDAPKPVLEKLLRLPYFIQAYEPDGMKKEDFNKQAALLATAAEFSRATRATVDFIAQQFQVLGHT